MQTLQEGILTYYQLTPRLYKILIQTPYVHTNPTIRAFQTKLYVAYFYIESTGNQVQVSIERALSFYNLWRALGGPWYQIDTIPNIGLSQFRPMVILGKPHRSAGH